MDKQVSVAGFPAHFLLAGSVGVAFAGEDLSTHNSEPVPNFVTTTGVSG